MKRGPCLSILIYHRVLARPDPLFPAEVDRARFERQMGLLRRCFTVLPLAQAVSRLAEGGLPARAACITFDDGYADNAEVALPVLQKFALPATFFIASGYLDGGQMWNDCVIDCVRQAAGSHLDLERWQLGRHAIATPRQRAGAIGQILMKLKYLPPAQRQQIALQLRPAGSPSPMMRSAQVQALHRGGMEIGAHTVSHPILSSLAPAQAWTEIAAGKRALESLIDAEVGSFAYPNGKPGRDYQACHVAMVRQQGFRAALSTSAGVSRDGADPYQLPRFTPWDRNSLRFLLRLQMNMGTSAARVQAEPAAG